MFSVFIQNLNLEYLVIKVQVFWKKAQKIWKLVLMLLSKSLKQVGDFFSNFVAFSQFFNFNLLKSMLSFLAAFFLFGKYWQFGQKFCGLKSMRCFRCTCIYFIQKGCKQFSFVRASHINAFNHENHRRALIQGRWS